MKGTSSYKQLALIKAKKSLNIPYDADCIQWAESLLYEGVQSDNILILASLALDKKFESYDVRHYFKKSLRDLNLSLPEEKEAITLYITQICNDIISHKLCPQAGVKTLYNLYCYNSDLLPDDHQVWLMIDDELDMIYWDESSFYGDPIMDMDAYIKDVAKEFILHLQGKSDIDTKLKDIRAAHSRKVKEKHISVNTPDGNVSYAKSKASPKSDNFVKYLLIITLMTILLFFLLL